MWLTVGHDGALRTLERGLRDARLAHAYMLVGPRHVGRMTLALDIARAVNCIGESPPCSECEQCTRIAGDLHADVRVVGLDGQDDADAAPRAAISIGQVRDVQRESSLKPYEGSCRVFIVDGAEQLTDEAANCLLKILEEPPDQVMLLLLALDGGALLPTIASRCQRLELKPLPIPLVAEELMTRGAVDHDDAERIARLSKGRLGWAIRAVTRPELLERRASTLEAIEKAVRGDLEERFQYAASVAGRFREGREAVRQELTLWMEWWRDVLLVREGLAESITNLSRLDALSELAGRLSLVQVVGAVRAIEETRDHLERNVNPRLALENLMLALPRATG